MGQARNANLLTLLLLACASASPRAQARDTKDLFADKKPAVVKIQVKELGVVINSGTGFFVAKDGTLITNRHVIEDAFSPGRFVSITNDDGKEAKQLRIGGCGGEKSIDLCVVKTDLAPKAWIPVNGLNKAPEGEKIYIVGHPMGLTYTLTDGMISAYRKIPSAKKNESIEFVQVSAPIYNGNSGGPIFDSKGLLVGVVTLRKAETQGFNFGITNAEVGQFLRAHTRFIPEADYRKQRAAAARGIAEKKLESLSSGGQLELSLASAGEASPDRPKVLIPAAYREACLQKRVDDYERVTCADSETDAEIRIELRSDARDRIAELWRMNGKALPPVPLSVTKTLMKDGQWGAVEKRLGPKTKAFFSLNTRVACRLQEQLKSCRTNLFNYETAGTVRTLFEAQFMNSGEHLSIEMVYRDPAYADYFTALGERIVNSYREFRSKSAPIAKKRTSLEFEGKIGAEIAEGGDREGDYLEYEFRTRDGETMNVRDYRFSSGRVPAAENGVRPNASVRLKGHFVPNRDGLLFVIPALSKGHSP